MENSFATFTPIELKSSPSKEDIASYYRENNITLSSNYLNEYLGLPQPTQSSSSFTVTEADKKQDQKLRNPSWNTVEDSEDYKYTNIPHSEVANTVINYFTNAGFSKEQAAGIAGNLYAESKLDHTIPQVNGPAFGIAQWEPPRQADFKRIMGKDIQNSSLKEQLDFILWELNNTESKAKSELLLAKTPAEAAKSFAMKYERMKTYSENREGFARGFYYNYI